MGEEDDMLDDSPADELDAPEPVEPPAELHPSREELRLEFEASRSEHRAGLEWGDYGLRLTSICERCPDEECEAACAGAVVLDARIRGPEHLRTGMTDAIRDLENALARYFDV